MRVCVCVVFRRVSLDTAHQQHTLTSDELSILWELVNHAVGAVDNTTDNAQTVSDDVSVVLFVIKFSVFFV